MKEPVDLPFMSKPRAEWERIALAALRASAFIGFTGTSTDARDTAAVLGQLHQTISDLLSMGRES